MYWETTTNSVILKLTTRPSEVSDKREETVS
jgi:hypothetical protein